MTPFERNCARMAARRHRWEVLKLCAPVMVASLLGYALGALTVWACYHW